jgi:antitoxin component HigA of HigAB toxin-antitoxin module
VGAKLSGGALGFGMMGMASSNISSGKGNKAVNYAGSVGGGALTGAMIAGPVGAAVGAAVGLAIAAYSDTKQTKESKEKTRIDDITTKIQIDQESVAELKDKASNEAALGNKEKVRDIEIDIEKTQKKIMKNARSIAGESSKAKKIIADMDKEIKASGDSMVKFGNTIRKAKQKFENMNKIIQSNHDLLKASQEFTLGGGSNAQASAFVKERMAMLQLDIENAKIQESRVRAISKEASVGDTSTLDADISSTKSEASGMTKGSDAHKVKMKELEDLMRQRKAVKDGDLTASKAEVNVAQAATAEKRNAMSSYLKEAIDQKHDLAERSTQADKDMAMASVDAYKSLMGGIGLSVGAIEQALGSIESQSEVVSQKMADQGDIIAKIKDKIANAGSVEGRNQAVAELKEASIKMKSFQKEKIGLIKEELELTKELRTGYLSAVTSQAMAAGTFSKIISTREQSIDKAMKYRDKGNQYDMVYGGLKDTKGSRARGAKGNRMQHGVGGIENADASKDALAEAMEANGETATKDTDRMLKQLNALQGSYDASPKKIGTAIGVQISGTGTAIQNAIMGGGGATLSTVNDSINRSFKAEGRKTDGGVTTPKATPNATPKATPKTTPENTLNITKDKKTIIELDIEQAKLQESKVNATPKTDSRDRAKADVIRKNQMRKNKIKLEKSYKTTTMGEGVVAGLNAPASAKKAASEALFGGKKKGDAKGIIADTKKIGKDIGGVVAMSVMALMPKLPSLKRDARNLGGEVPDLEEYTGKKKARYASNMPMPDGSDTGELMMSGFAMAQNILKGFTKGGDEAEKTGEKTGTKTAKKTSGKVGKGITGGKILSDKASIFAGASGSGIKKFGRELKYDKLGIESTQSGVSGLNSKQEKIMRDESKEGVPKKKGGPAVAPGAVTVNIDGTNKNTAEVAKEAGQAVEKGIIDEAAKAAKSGDIT